MPMKPKPTIPIRTISVSPCSGRLAAFYRFHESHRFGPFSMIFRPFFHVILPRFCCSFFRLSSRKTAVRGYYGGFAAVLAARDHANSLRRANLPARGSNGGVLDPGHFAEFSVTLGIPSPLYY